VGYTPWSERLRAATNSSKRGTIKKKNIKRERGCYGCQRAVGKGEKYGKRKGLRGEPYVAERGT